MAIDAHIVSEAPADTVAIPGLFRRVQTHWVGVGSAVVLLMLIVLAVFGPLIAPHDPHAQDIINRLKPPAWNAGGSWSYVLGTDQLGRDLLSRIIVATRLTLLFALATVTIEAVIGVTLGLAAGYLGGWVDSLIMRWTDIQMGFPAALLVIFVLLVAGANTVTLAIALGINGWMIFTRIVRVEVRRIKTRGYVEAAVVAGARRTTILRQHVLPHVRGSVIQLFLLELPRIILAEATLSFIGLGIQPPSVTWGQLIGGSRDLIPVAYYLGVFPGLMIVVTVASLYLFASWVEPWIDPLRRRR